MNQLADLFDERIHLDNIETDDDGNPVFDYLEWRKRRRVQKRVAGKVVSEQYTWNMRRPRVDRPLRPGMSSRPPANKFYSSTFNS